MSKPDRARELMVGMGFQEIISNILGSPEQYRDAMRLNKLLGRNGRG